jgi:hypothetical protein
MTHDMVSPVLPADEIPFLADRNMAEFHKVQALWTRAGETVTRDDAQLVASSTRFRPGRVAARSRAAKKSTAWRGHSLARAASDAGPSTCVRAASPHRLPRDHAVRVALPDPGADGGGARCIMRGGADQPASLQGALGSVTSLGGAVVSSVRAPSLGWLK